MRWPDTPIVFHGPLLDFPLSELIRQAVPPWVVPVFIGITQLGNIGFLLVLLALDYWFGDSERGAHAIGLAIGGMALVTALKSYFAVPRPPEEVQLIQITGYGFPSGHATASTIVYGALAYDLKIGSWAVRYGMASLLIVLIALSRVVLGVHSVTDVVAGVIVGLLFLAGMIALTHHAPRPGFLLALGLGVIAFVVSRGNNNGAAVLGAAIGAVLAWELLDHVPTINSLAGRLVLVGGVLPTLALLGYLSTIHGLASPVVFVLNGGVLGGLLLSPWLVQRYTSG